MFTLHILCFNIIKIVTVNKGPLRSLFCLLCKVFVLTCLRMTKVQAEKCSIQVMVIKMN
jgi:hypothetical protein